jgi:hypothetical protein
MRALRESGSSRSGEVLNGAYELRDLVRSEGPYEVYHGVERRMHRRVSVTLVRPEFALQAKVLDEFVSIPKQLLSRERAGWPKILAVDTDDIGVPFVVFEVKAGQGPTALLDRLLHGRDETQPIESNTQPTAADAAAEKPAHTPRSEPAKAGADAVGMARTLAAPVAAPVIAQPVPSGRRARA